MPETPRTLVVLGADGDLAGRLLLPGTGQLLASSRGRGILLLGAGLAPLTPDGWRERVAASFAAGGAEGPLVDEVLAATRYLQCDVTRPEELGRLLAACDGPPALYFALPPAVTVAACEALARVERPDGLVLALEKPFGTDLAGARSLNERVAALVPEHRVHRVDHFLGKSTVLNLLGLRFANRFLEPLWSAQHIERVEIVFDEVLALEDRAGYYDRAGALVDMIQSHLLLVLALIAMEPPTSIHADDLRDGMVRMLRATRLAHDDAARASRRARYTAGELSGRALPDYADEAGVDPARETETLAEISLRIDSWRWAGVPFVLRSGKALADQRKDITVVFREVPHLPFGFRGRKGPERLRISLSPDVLEFDIGINGEGDPFELDPVTLRAEFAAGELGPYGEVLAGILAGDDTLSVRGDGVEECWRIVAPILEAWAERRVPLDEYPAGSAGPDGWTGSPLAAEAAP